MYEPFFEWVASIRKMQKSVESEWLNLIDFLHSHPEYIQTLNPANIYYINEMCERYNKISPLQANRPRAQRMPERELETKPSTDSNTLANRVESVLETKSIPKYEYVNGVLV